MRKILTVIPIRGGSLGIQNKNIRPLSGIPLVGYGIKAARRVTRLQKIIVSTDNEMYAKIANEYGAETPFIRPSELANPEVRLHDVMKHALFYFDELGEHFDAVLSLQATVPLVRPETIRKVIAKFDQYNCDAVGTVTEVRHFHPYICKSLVGDEKDIAIDFMNLAPEIKRYPRQVRPPIYYFNGSMFLRDRKLLENIDEGTNCLGESPRAIVMDEMESVNIDEEIDFKIAEYFMKNRTINHADSP